MLGRTGDAARLFERILLAQPDRVPALLGLASTKSGRPFDAEQLLRRVLAIEPDHRAARAALAETLSFMGREKEALEYR
jgi:Flp pilus assembly protein TadD